MEERSINQVAAACGGEVLAGNAQAVVRRISTDSRRVEPGDLFVALSGERFDGHDFVLDVAQKGAAAVVVDRSRAPGPLAGCALLAVDNTRLSLGRLAASYRNEFDLPVVAVGGSNGKTTTKQLLASVLGQRFATLASEASFNNDIGVPLTLLRLNRSHQAAVLEVGTNHPGELAPLIRMINPRFGVITSIGREHLEFFGDVTGVAEEEGWLAELLPADGKLFINGDSSEAERIIKRCRAAVVRIGFGEHNDWRAANVRLDGEGTVFDLTAPDGFFNGECRVNLLGRHQAVNAMLALAVGAELGMGREELLKGLRECQPAKWRLQRSVVNGIELLDDAYNANADSMLAALETLRDLPCAGRRVAVLGEMAELGAAGPAAHEEVGRRAAEARVDFLVAVGKLARVTAAAAREAGLANVIEAAGAEDAVSALRNYLKPGDSILVKASRSARLERVCEALRSGRQ